MRTIFKYELAIVPQQVLSLPYEAQILSTQMQGKRLQLWAEVDPEEPRRIDRHFCVIGTGHKIPDGVLFYMSTVQDDPFIWHIYEALS